LKTPAQIAVPWYTREEYPVLAAAAPDVPATFEEFERLASARFDRFLARGAPLVRVTISVAELLRWCAANATAPDGPARAAFVALVAERRSRGN
jgi:hypothetical protein